MNELILELPYFNAETPREELLEWVRLAEEEIEQMNEKEGQLFFLLLSEFHAIYLRDIPTAYETLKRINIQMPAVSDEIKVRRCFYKYLEGAYQFALEQLADIIRQSSNIAPRKIAVDFFRRVFQREQLPGHSKFKSKIRSKQAYEEDLLKALKYERSGSIKLALEMHRAIYNKYGSLNEAILYESAKHIERLLQLQKSSIDRAELQEYQKTIRDFELKVQNKGYFEMKVQFIWQVLGFIDPEKQQEEAVIDYQLAKNFIIQNLERAISKATDRTTINSLQATLSSLQQNQKVGEEICFKFLGDKAYNKLLLQSSIPEKSILKPPLNKNSKARPKEAPKEDEGVEEEVVRPPSKSMTANKKPKQDSNDDRKQKGSKLIKKGQDLPFEGSNMVKINYNSGGYEERYFYVNEDFMSTKKLFYCSSKNKVSRSDEYYSLKGLKSISLGKVSDALKRSECDQFPEDHCFTLKVNNQQKYERNFYVKDEEDYDNWVTLFEELLNNQKSAISKMKKTRVVIS